MKKSKLVAAQVAIKARQEQTTITRDTTSCKATPVIVSPYTIDDLVKLHNMSRRTVTRLYENEPGVQILEREETCHKRRYRTIRVPVAVYEKVKAKLEGRIQSSFSLPFGRKSERLSASAVA